MADDSFMMSVTEKWRLLNIKGDFKQIADELGVTQITAKILVNRGLDTVEKRRAFFKPSIENMYAPELLKNALRAAEIIYEAVLEGKKIRIVGDYDVDGIMSVYVLHKGLMDIEMQLYKSGKLSYNPVEKTHIDYKIPDRIVDGYGINKNIISQAHEDGIGLIVTCDNGIAAIEQVQYCKELGMSIVVTDHHEIREENGIRVYPDADCIVDPNQDGETYPFRGICGAVVAYKVMKSVYHVMGADEKVCDRFIPYIAMATVCDVMELRDENRSIVCEGLKMLADCNDIGIKALIRENKLEGKQLTAFDMGFITGPCLNASGRLETAQKGLMLLEETDPDMAEKRAKELAELNEERKKMTLEAVEKAIAVIDKEHSEDKVLVVYLNDCHESLAGIVAGRIREKYYKPVIVLTEAEGMVKGSARSIEEYNIFAELTKCSNLLVKFGGHPMAAGMSLERENVSLLRERLNAITTLTEEELQEKVLIDAQVSFENLDERLIQELMYLEPFGKGNIKPVFAESGVKVRRLSRIGKQAQYLKFQLVNAKGYQTDAMYFGNADDFDTYITENYGENELKNMYQGRSEKARISITYYPQINEFNGRRSIQIVIGKYKVTR